MRVKFRKLKKYDKIFKIGKKTNITEKPTNVCKRATTNDIRY